MKIIAFIPARSGSKGVSHKNIRKLGELPLIAYSILLAKMVKEIDRVIVSTDIEEYGLIAKEFGAEVPFLRPKNISGDKSTDLDAFKHCINWLEENENYKPELIFHFRPTTPLRSPLIIKDALKMIIDNPSTSLRSGHKTPESPFKWFLKDEEGYFKGLKDNIDSERVNMPRQVFPDVYVPDGYVDIIKTDTIIEQGTLHGDKMLVFESPICYEIDTEEDFKFLEYKIDNESSPIIEYHNNLKK
ncbi:acylneuraminate cytidylyltransferase family protein [Flavobacteriaceae bacterium]|nr:acylneuraminate cytidylyltransferase family protein [Flavobacteriaceae bacterium]